MIEKIISISKEEFFEKFRYKSVSQLKEMRNKMKRNNKLKGWLDELIKIYKDRYFNVLQFKKKFCYPKIINLPKDELNIMEYKDKNILTIMEQSKNGIHRHA